MDIVDQGLRDIIYALALKYAVKYGGKTSAKSLVGKLIAIRPDIKAHIKDVIPHIERIVNEVNNLTLEEQKTLLEKYSEILPKEKPKEEKKALPPLSGAEEGKVRMRFAPGPSGPLHIGHSRAVVLNDEYVRMYKGALILRLEDTNPKNVLPEAYDMIKEDVSWLKAKWHEFYIQSDRIEIYYEHAKKLLEMGKAYICTEDPE
ncbi:MAG: glutamate--tRNA ligase, partial [Thermoplasmata archaeon]